MHIFHNKTSVDTNIRIKHVGDIASVDYTTRLDLDLLKPRTRASIRNQINQNYMYNSGYGKMDAVMNSLLHKIGKPEYRFPIISNQSILVDNGIEELGQRIKLLTTLFNIKKSYECDSGQVFFIPGSLSGTPLKKFKKEVANILYSFPERLLSEGQRLHMINLLDSGVIIEQTSKISPD